MPPELKLPPQVLKWSGWTDRGKVRVNNEDAFLGLQFDAKSVEHLGRHGESSTQNLDFAFAVSDGMGGARAGEYASRIAVDKITIKLPRLFQRSGHKTETGFGGVLTELFLDIHRALTFLGESYEECAGMEATLSLCWFTPGRAYFGHIGDSRIYHLPQGKQDMLQLTHDDTHVGWLRRRGELSEWEARNHPRRNVLQKALGGSNQFVEPHVGAVNCEPGDVFLLCTDGLTEGIHENRLVELLRRPFTNQPDFARELVNEALANDGRDNATALVIRVG
jgi:protein phosphatase